MAKKNFYAVKVGKKTGVFKTWEECKKNVVGYKGAVHKGFGTLEEANEFLGIAAKKEIKPKKATTTKKEKKKPTEKSTVTDKKDSIKGIRSEAKVEVLKSYVDYKEIKEKYDFIAFVDGSYDKTTKTYGGGVVVLDIENNEHKCYSCAGFDKWDQWNIIGEIEATKLALAIAKDEYKAKNVAIYHDLINISLWASGEWQAKNEYTQDYVKSIEKISEELNVCFVKVKAHSTESIYNDIADETAKNAIEEYNYNNGATVIKKNSKKSEKIIVTLPSEVKNKLDDECKRLDMTYDEAIKNLINEWVGY